jgi:hypothetical protein
MSAFEQYYNDDGDNDNLADDDSSIGKRSQDVL